MGKQPNIRWITSQRERLAKAVTNYNAKVRRLEKKYEGTPGVVIPERITQKSMRELIGTNRDLQKEIRSLQSFTQRGSEELIKLDTQDNIYVTKWQKQDLEARAKIINAERARRREELESKELIHKGEGLGYTRGSVGMGKAEALQLRVTTPFTPKMSKGDVNARMEHYRRESQSVYWNRRDMIMRDNYIQALKDQFNSLSDDLIEKISTMDLERVKDIIMSDPQEFNTAYPLTTAEIDPYLEHLYEMWGLEKPDQETWKANIDKAITKIEKTKSKKRK